MYYVLEPSDNNWLASLMPTLQGTWNSFLDFSKLQVQECKGYFSLLFMRELKRFELFMLPLCFLCRDANKKLTNLIEKL